MKNGKLFKISLKYLKRILVVICSLLGLIILAAVIITTCYEESVKKFIIEKINKNLNSEIQVKKISLSLFKKFPDATLVFEEIVAKDAIKSTNKGNLLQADEVLLNFNLFDIFNKNYRIKKIEVVRGHLNLIVFNDGSDNYHFWKEDTTELADNSFQFDLQKLIMSDLSIRYTNFTTNQDYYGKANDVVLKGKFKSDQYALNIDGDLQINNIKISGVSYFPGKKAIISAILDVQSSSGIYSFNKGNIKIGDMHFDLSGQVVYNDTKQFIQLAIKGKNIDLQSAMNEVPSTYRKYVDGYSAKGRLYFDASIKGSYYNSNIPDINIVFGIKNGRIVQKSSKLALEHVNFNAVFSNGKKQTSETAYLNFKDFAARLKSGVFNGSLLISNFKNPFINMSLNAKAELKDIAEFLNADTLSSVTGNVDVVMSYNGRLSSDKRTAANEFVQSKSTGTINFTNVNFKIKNNPHEYKDIEAQCEFNNNDIIINRLSGNISSSDFSVNGCFHNALAYIFLKNDQLVVDAKITSVNCDLDNLMQYESEGKDASYQLNMPDNIAVKLDLNISKFNFKKFKASNIKGELVYKNQLLNASNLSFASTDGNTKAMLIIDGRNKGRLLISCDAQISQVNIRKLFYEFGNFGQESLKDENLKGTINADVKFAGVWSSQLKPEMDKMYATADLKVENGELLNYKPMQKLSSFLKVADLANIKFSTLHNQIEIKNKTIYMPAMEIKSSAVNIVASGTHTFDNEIHYNIKLQLLELMSKKARTAKKENETFGVVEDDGLGKTSLFIVVTGTVDNPVYKYDAQGVKEKIVVGFIKEKHTLKTILNEEFGWFKKDTSIKKTDNKLPELKTKSKNKEKENIKKQEEGKFVIEWDEE